MERIDKNQIEIVRNKFIGKKIEFKNESGERFVGVCQYLDYNPNFPTWGLQVTVDRLPVPHVKFNTIKFFETKKTL